MKKRMVLVLCAVMCLGMFAGCADSREGKLFVGTSADYPPFEFHMVSQEGKDEIVGIDISVAQAIADEMGLELEVVDMGFANLITALDKGEVDMVISAMEIMPDREGSADYSDTYYKDLPYMILVKKENQSKFKDLSSFSGHSVGAQTGTTMENIVAEKMPGADLLSLSSVTDLVNNLVYGKCDALVLNGAVAQEYAASDPGLAISGIKLDQQPEYHAAVAQGDPKGLLPAINETIGKLVKEGKIQEFISQAEADNEFALVG